MVPNTLCYDVGHLCISRPFLLWLDYRLSAGGTRVSYRRIKPCCTPSLASLRRPLSLRQTISSSPLYLSLSLPLHPVVLFLCLLRFTSQAGLSISSLCFALGKLYHPFFRSPCFSPGFGEGQPLTFLLQAAALKIFIDLQNQ